MNISEASRGSGVSAKAIRYYESINLITPARRAGNGYRDFNGDDVHMLRFIARARGLGFSVLEVADLLALYKDKTRASAQVRGLAEKPSRGWVKKLQNCNRFPWFCLIWWPAAKVTIVPIAPFWTTCPVSTENTNAYLSKY